MSDRDDAISSGESENEAYVNRHAILKPAISSVIDALGGVEGGVYRLGDECYGCLKDLKKYWRKDDTDDERTVARIFWDTRVLSNDLIPILLETAGKGLVEDKRAIACADLMTAMTWPIDMAEELKELDEVEDKGTDYTQLLLSHLNYKAALLKPGVMEALFSIMLPCLAKDTKERKERDVQVINVVLYLIRNLAFIKDLPANMYLSADQAEYSSLQSRLIKVLSDTHILDLLLTIASNASSNPLFNGWNVLTLEIIYLLFRGVKPSDLAGDQTKQPAQNLQRLLAMEDQRKRDYARKAASRHSRFGTTIAVTLNPKKAQKKDADGGDNAPAHDDSSTGSSQAYVLHRQQAINGESGAILDMAGAKRPKTQKSKKVDELAREDNLSLEAKSILQNFARTFIESCFNPLLSSLLKDIKAERPKITEKDNVRLLFVTKWFLEFFLSVRAKEGSTSSFNFGYISEVIERSWIIWILKRMSEAAEEKPKLWTELQAGIECLTQVVLVVDAMSSSTMDATLTEAAEVLQQQIIYNGQVLDIAFESLKTYKEGTQSLAYLDSSVHLGYALLRMLERWGKKRGGSAEAAYVRKKAKAKKRKARTITEEEGVPDVEEEESQEEDMILETMFSFEALEIKFAQADITHTLLVYLERYKEFKSSENMKRVVNLMHRQAVKAKAEGLFFQVSTLDLFKRILAEEKSLPKEQPYKDLIALIHYILRKFFKAVEEDPVLIVAAFYPMNRGHWKQFSSWEPEEKTKTNATEDSRFPPEVRVKKGYTWSEQLGIAIACLVNNDKKHLVEWTKQILTLAIAQRQRIIEDTDGSSSRGPVQDVDSDSDASESERVRNLKRGPSSEALAKITDYMIPYVNEEQATAATRDPHLKLLFRLVKFFVSDPDADELEWYIPAAVLPSDMQQTVDVINQFLETPFDLDGKNAASLLSKQRKRRKRVRAASESDAEDSDAPPKHKKEKKKKETKQYKSAQFIEDSDEEYGDMAAFLEKEKALREKTALAAAASGQSANMRPTGTKKRRRKAADDKAGKKKRKRRGAADENGSDTDRGDASQNDSSDQDIFNSPKQSIATGDTTPDHLEVESTKPRPRPKPAFKGKNVSNDPEASSRRSMSRDSPSLDERGADVEAHPSPTSVHSRPDLNATSRESPSPSGHSSDEAATDLIAGLGSRRKGRKQLVISDDED